MRKISQHFLCQIRKDLAIIRGVVELSFSFFEFVMIIHYVQIITILDCMMKVNAFEFP